MGRVGAFVDSFVVGHRAAIVRHAVVHFVLAFVLWSNTLVTTRGRSGFRSRGHAGWWEERVNSAGVTHVPQLSACQWLSVGRSDCVQLDRNRSSQGGDEWEWERTNRLVHWHLCMQTSNPLQPGLWSATCHLARDKSHRNVQAWSRLLLKLVPGDWTSQWFP